MYSPFLTQWLRLSASGSNKYKIFKVKYLNVLFVEWKFLKEQLLAVASIALDLMKINWFHFGINFLRKAPRSTGEQGACLFKKRSAR